MQDIFLSYSRDDQAIARRFAGGFELAGFSVWWDVTLKSGEDYDKVTEQALRGAKAVVVLWSTKSVESRWVRTEATIALQNKTLVPVMIEPCQRPIMFELSQSAELGHWKGDDRDPAWLALVSDLQHLVHQGQATAAVAPIATIPTRRQGLRLTLSLAALLVAAVAAWALSRTVGTTSPPNAQITAATEPAVPAATTTLLANAIAVLPFTNISPNAEDAYFATGLHEEILNQLAKVSKLKVISRQSVLRYSGSTLSMPEIANELRVGFIMEGSVRYAGNRIRITTQLIEAASDAQVWSETFDEEFSDVFAIESQVAVEVANAMRVSFSAEEAAQIASIPTTSPEAYALYLQSLGDSNFADQATVDSMLVRLDRALVLDPAFALAYRRKAQLFDSLGDATQAAANRRRAVELAPALGNLENLQIQELMMQNQLAESAALVEARLALHGEDLATLELAREVQMRLGNNAAALDISLQMLAVDPAITGYAFYSRLGTLYARVGRYEEALQAFERNQLTSPQSPTGQIDMSNVLSVLSRPSEALQWLKSAEFLMLGDGDEGGNALGYSALIFGYSLAGSTADAERLFARFQTMEAEADLPSRARAYLGVGDYATALALLEQMAANKTFFEANGYLAHQQLRDNPFQLEVLNRPEFVAARSKL